MKNQALELHSPLPKSFKVCKERKTEWRKQRTAATVFLRTFGALPEVHFLHAIYHFKSQEVKNPTLQTVYDLDLKWGRYGLRKATASSWGTISHLAKLELQRVKFKVDGSCVVAVKPSIQSWFFNLWTWISTCESGFYVAKSTCEILASQHVMCETRIFVPTLFLLIFLCLNFPFLLVFSHSCNSLARKYPWRGKLPFYINSLVNTKKGLSGSFSQKTNLCIFDT